MTDHKSSHISSDYHLLLEFFRATLRSLSHKSKHKFSNENVNTKHVQGKLTSTLLGYYFFLKC